MTTRQLVVFAVVVVALTLSLAWLVERRTVLSLRQQLDSWGAPLPPPSAGAPPTDPNAPIVGWDDEGPDVE